MSKTLLKRSFGDILVSKNKRSKRLILKIKTDGTIHLSAPIFASTKEITRFIDSKQEWIIKNKKIINSRIKIISNTEALQTYSFKVKLQAKACNEFQAKIENEVLYITYPHHLDSQSEYCQKKFKSIIENALKHEAKRIIPPLVEQFSLLFDLPYSQVKISASKTRWGSCSHKKNINISYYVLLLPKHLIEYVLLHELCHTKEMNHGENFWNLLNQVSNHQAKEISKELKSYSTSI